jgi:hypothetical protein
MTGPLFDEDEIVDWERAGVNFTNNFLAVFLYFKFKFILLYCKKIDVKAALKTLVKLTPALTNYPPMFLALVNCDESMIKYFVSIGASFKFLSKRNLSRVNSI